MKSDLAREVLAEEDYRKDFFERSWKDEYFENMTEVLKFLRDKKFKGTEFKVIYQPVPLAKKPYCVLYAVMIEKNAGEVLYGHIDD